MTRAQRRRLRAILFPILAVLLTLSLWEVTADLWEVPELIVPSPLAVLGTLQEQYPDLLHAMAGTFREVLEGSALAFFGGLLLGMAMFYSEILRRTLLSYIVLTQIVPKIAIAPVLVAWLGIGSGARLMIAFLIAFFPMVINTVAGLECTEKDMLLYARSLSATKSQIFWKIRLPRSLPALLAGLRIAVASSIIGIIVLFAWELGCRFFSVRPSLLPAPTAVARRFLEESDLLGQNVLPTLSQTVLGFLLSVVVGILCGWVIVKSEIMSDTLYPLIVIFQVLPKETLAPILMLWFGAGVLPRLQIGRA